jgi:phosphoribosylaminoimidazole-succinocarboxamide synthase
MTMTAQPSSRTSPSARTAAVFETHLPLPERRQGKVRDVYALPSQPGKEKRLAIVATDRISAFDVVMPTPVPDKGCILTDISVKWFELLRSRRLVKDHLLSTDPAEIPGLSSEQIAQVTGRLMVCKAVKIIPIECVARGYIAGSGWAEYQTTQKVCGVPLPAGLRQGDQLPEPIFTPATKEDQGHDQNIDFDTTTSIIGRELAAKLKSLTLALYSAAAQHAESRGIILADTKFEFGFALDEKGQPTSDLLLADEVLTPDSSRFWPKDSYQPGRDQDSFDKQFLREYLQGLVKAGRWNKTAPGPELPQEIVEKTHARYVEARKRLFG